MKPKNKTDITKVQQDKLQRH